jgi:hypothetical protein
VPWRQKVFFLTIAVVLLLTIIDLVRRRRMRVEYSWVWIAAGVAIIVLIVQYDLLIWLTTAVGAVIPTSTLFFLSSLYLAVLSLNYAVRLSSLSWEVKELAQELALLRQTCEANHAAASGARGQSSLPDRTADSSA